MAVTVAQMVAPDFNAYAFGMTAPKVADRQEGNRPSRKH